MKRKEKRELIQRFIQTSSEETISEEFKQAVLKAFWTILDDLEDVIFPVSEVLVPFYILSLEHIARMLRFCRPDAEDIAKEMKKLIVAESRVLSNVEMKENWGK